MDEVSLERMLSNKMVLTPNSVADDGEIDFQVDIPPPMADIPPPMDAIRTIHISSKSPVWLTYFDQRFSYLCSILLTPYD